MIHKKVRRRSALCFSISIPQGGLRVKEVDKRAEATHSKDKRDLL